MSWFQSKLYNEHQADRQLTIAAVTMRCQSDPAANRANLIEKVESIARDHPEVDLVFFGETVLGFYLPAEDPGYIQSIAESVPGETTNSLALLAARHRIYIAFGIPERDGHLLYNTQVLINSAGELQAVHRKHQLKENTYTPGTIPLSLTKINGVQTALLICADAASPATMRALIRSRLDLILLSLADDEDKDFFMARCNARLYDAWIATANRFGQEPGRFWNGHTVISDPLGRLRAVSKDQEQVLIKTLRFPPPTSKLVRLLRRADCHPAGSTPDS